MTEHVSLLQHSCNQEFKEARQRFLALVPGVFISDLTCPQRA